MTKLLEYFSSRRADMLKLLNEMVQRESFTSEKASVDRLVDFMESHLHSRGASSVQRVAQADVGDFLLAKWNDEAAGKPYLLLAHLDTVHPTSSPDTMPIQIEDGRFYGPGALDMKAGIVIALEAISALRERNQLPQRPIHFLLTTDEEIGSPFSEALIKEQARHCELVLVMEPATKEGAIKTWRKGGGKYSLTIDGRAAHAGIAPQEGINAIIEFAQQAVDINRLNDLKYGTSVSITLVEGGSAGNVIPAQVRAHIDTRVLTMEAMNRLHAALTSLYPKMPGAKVNCVRERQRPPMERRPELFAKAAAIGERHGLAIYEGGTGGGSDGNFTAAMGVPTLDGLGAHGDGAHAPHEHVIIDSLPRQAALIAALLMEW
ncbi:MAG: M20 family metallopeptidase [Chloroflexota bacterium]|nr:M20 family metallopeptidase [Chloroflexota bacterium]MDE2911035.1 M20 family metallopeptidase [Chloroflexota bacterium]